MANLFNSDTTSGLASMYNPNVQTTGAPVTQPTATPTSNGLIDIYGQGNRNNINPGFMTGLQAAMKDRDSIYNNLAANQNSDVLSGLWDRDASSQAFTKFLQSQNIDPTKYQSNLFNNDGSWDANQWQNVDMRLLNSVMQYNGVNDPIKAMDFIQQYQKHNGVQAGDIAGDRDGIAYALANGLSPEDAAKYSEDYRSSHGHDASVVSQLGKVGLGALGIFMGGAAAGLWGGGGAAATGAGAATDAALTGGATEAGGATGSGLSSGSGLVGGGSESGAVGSGLSSGASSAATSTGTGLGGQFNFSLANGTGDIFGPGAFGTTAMSTPTSYGTPNMNMPLASGGELGPTGVVPTGTGETLGTGSGFWNSGTGAMIKDAVGTANNVKNGFNLLQGITGLYNANQAYNSSVANQHILDNTIQSLQSMYQDGSPWANQLKEEMARKDAAAGHNSQYGPRLAQYQAAIANKAAETARTIGELVQQQNATNTQVNNNRNSQWNILNDLYDKSGAKSWVDNWATDNIGSPVENYLKSLFP
jgi:hypothetical protein